MTSVHMNDQRWSALVEVGALCIFQYMWEARIECARRAPDGTGPTHAQWRAALAGANTPERAAQFAHYIVTTESHAAGLLAPRHRHAVLSGMWGYVCRHPDLAAFDTTVQTQGAMHRLCEACLCTACTHCGVEVVQPCAAPVAARTGINTTIAAAALRARQDDPPPHAMSAAGPPSANTDTLGGRSGHSGHSVQVWSAPHGETAAPAEALGVEHSMSCIAP